MMAPFEQAGPAPAGWHAYQSNLPTTPRGRAGPPAAGSGSGEQCTPRRCDAHRPSEACHHMRGRGASSLQPSFIQLASQWLAQDDGLGLTSWWLAGFGAVARLSWPLVPRPWHRKQGPPARAAATLLPPARCTPCRPAPPAPLARTLRFVPRRPRPTPRGLGTRACAALGCGRAVPCPAAPPPAGVRLRDPWLRFRGPVSDRPLPSQPRTPALRACRPRRHDLRVYGCCCAATRRTRACRLWPLARWLAAIQPRAAATG
uniref:Uncharacterized protein n=1 Tax=Setaria viridis TaxID=4556 RepID=A0A4U6V6J7_SETVI|nr:LOW QUALITY PROTEIN: hypothetical protein SEVIR_4G237300v2 [Setaria viridis]